MKVTAERVPESKVLLRIEVPPEQVEQAIEKTYRDLSRRVKIPGFRPGKAPRSLVEKYLGGPESVQQEGVDRAIDDSYREALRETNTRPVGDPDIAERPDFVPGEPLIFQATVPVGPRVELGDYTSIRLSPPPGMDVTDADVERFLDELRRSNSDVTAVDRPAQDGDRVTIDVLGVVDATPSLFGADGETILATTGGREVFNVKAHDHGIDVHGPIEFAPGFDEELVGMTDGTEKRFGLTLPLDHADPQLAGKSVVFTVNLSSIREQHIPELDDAFAMKVARADSVDELRQLASTQLASRLKRESDTLYDNLLLEAVINRSSVEVPEVMVDTHIDGQIADLKAELTRAKLLWQDYLDRSQTTEAQIRLSMRDRAITSIRGFLILREMARAEKIQVSPGEISREIDAMAAAFGRAGKVVRERLATHEERERIESRLLNVKIIQRLAEIAQQPGIENQDSPAVEVLESGASDEAGSVEASDEPVANVPAESPTNESSQVAPTEE